MIIEIFGSTIDDAVVRFMDRQGRILYEIPLVDHVARAFKCRLS